MCVQTLEKTLVLSPDLTTYTARLDSAAVHASSGKATSNLVGSPSGTPEMSPTFRQTTCCLRKRGEIKNPTIGMPSSTATTAPETWVPRSPNWRRLSRRGSRCAIANEPIEDARCAQHDEQQHHRHGAADQPEGERGLIVRLAKPAHQPEDDDADEEQRDADHDGRDQRQVKEGLKRAHYG